MRLCCRQVAARGLRAIRRSCARSCPIPVDLVAPMVAMVAAVIVEAARAAKEDRAKEKVAEEEEETAAEYWRGCPRDA